MKIGSLSNEENLFKRDGFYRPLFKYHICRNCQPIRPSGGIREKQCVDCRTKATLDRYA